MSDEWMSRVWAQPDSEPVVSLRQWETVLGQARQSRLIARLAHHYLSKAWLGHVPDAPRLYLDGALRLAARQRHEVHWEISCICRALQDADFPVVVLKGAAYLLADLPPAAGRLFADIDIMVPREHLDAAEHALFSAGWISDERDAYNQRYYREWMHEIPPLRHVQRETSIDLHHTITPPTSRFPIDGNKLLERICPVTGYPRLYVLAPEDMVLHSAVHLFQDGEFGHGLRDLLDLNDLLLHFGMQSGFWDLLLDRAEELGLGIPLFHALFHTHRLFGTAAPSHLQQRVNDLGPSRASRASMAWMLGLALRPMHPSCDTRWTGLARWLLYVRSHALRMPLYLALPHLARKAWMLRFPEKGPEPAP